ncbi:MAG: hypothetical protein LQ346_008296, partial [Caloplaca aetnensis]
NIKEGIQGHGVSWYSDVFDLVFPDLDRDAANGMWKEQLLAGKEDADKKSREKESDDGEE